MGKLNEVQEQSTQSWGSNSFTTTIKENTVEFDSSKDKFTFNDEIEVPSLKVNGTQMEIFDSTEKAKLDSISTPMNIKGRVNTVSDLDNLTNVKVGDVWLVGLSGSEDFYEYLCIALDNSTPNWECLGKASSEQVQPDWEQNDTEAPDFIKNRICYNTGIKTEYVSDTFEQEYISYDLGGIEAPSPTPSDTYILRAKFSNSDEWEEMVFTFKNGLVQGDTTTYSDQTPDNEHPVFMLDDSLSVIVYYWDEDDSDTHEFYFDLYNEAYETGSVDFQFGKGEIKLIDDNFISSNIARVSLMPTNIVNGEFKGSIKSNPLGYIENDGEYSFALGPQSVASGSLSVCIGERFCESSGFNSIAIGFDAKSEGATSVAIGQGANTQGNNSIAIGTNSQAKYDYQFVFGRNNARDNQNIYPTWVSGTSYNVGDLIKYYNSTFDKTFVYECKTANSDVTFDDHKWNYYGEIGAYIEIVGNGTNSNYKNARTLDWSGNEQIAGTLRIGSTSTGGVLLKEDSGTLKISFDNGSTWLTVQAS